MLIDRDKCESFLAQQNGAVVVWMQLELVSLAICETLHSLFVLKNQGTNNI